LRNAGSQPARCGRRGAQLRLVAAVLAGLCALRSPARTGAFSEPQIYADEAATGGGGGRWFTGSPAEGYDCSVCHTGQVRYPVYHTGLPLDGWVPGTGYTIKLAWPEAAAQALSAQAAGLRPSTSIVAELVADDGGPSGTVDLQPSFAAPQELCAPAAGSGDAALAASVFTVDGEQPAVRGTVCTAAEKNQRCLVAVAACGSSELRIRWTAPERWGATIWLSASMVATANASGIADDDADGVTALSIPIHAASEPATHNVALHGGCAAAGPQPSAASSAWLIVLLLIALRRCRSALTLALLTGCGAAPGANADNVGLFTPGYRPERTAPLTAASGAAADGGAAEQLTCMGQTFQSTVDADGGAQHPGGSLQVDFTTGLLPVGDYDKAGNQENYGVAWIEDDAGRYVTGLTQWGAKYRLRLSTWYFGSGRIPAEPNKGRLGCADPDIIVQPSIHMHMAHSVTWQGTDTARESVPDGNYTLWFEVQIDERHIQTAVSYPFVKGRMPWTQQLPAATPLQALTLTYTPES
jgi:hypothetical protein